MRLEAMQLVNLQKRKPVAPRPPPQPNAKKSRTEQRVFLPKKKWEALTEIAQFQEESFAASGEPASVSRNDVIDGFLGWAIKEFWKDKGGRPKSEKEWAEKVKKFGEYLAASQPDEDEDE